MLRVWALGPPMHLSRERRGRRRHTHRCSHLAASWRVPLITARVHIYLSRLIAQRQRQRATSPLPRPPTRTPLASNDKMSGAAKPAASRAVKTAAGAWSTRAGRIDGRAWRDVERALKLGKKHGAHSVEAHGVRFVFMGAHRPQVEPTGGKRTSAQARCERDEPAREPSERTDAAPNSAQRRSAARMIRFIQAKKGSGPSVGSDPAAPARTSAQTPALVESDERAGAQPMDTTEADEGRQDAGAVVATAPAPTNIGPQGPSQVESTGRDRFSRGGLQPLHVSPEERRRENAANALENQRSARGRG